VAGVVMGLAWTAMGGATLYIETVNDRPLYSALKRSQPGTNACVRAARTTTL
jgi:ATP-dependent Lon protease